MAAFLNMPLDSDALQIVLTQLPQDMEWNKDLPLERALFQAAEPRYDMTGLQKTYKQSSHEEFVGEKTTASKEKKAKSKEDIPSSGSTVKIKTEAPNIREFKQKMHVLKTGKGDSLNSFCSFADDS